MSLKDYSACLAVCVSEMALPLFQAKDETKSSGGSENHEVTGGTSRSAFVSTHNLQDGRQLKETKTQEREFNSNYFLSLYLYIYLSYRYIISVLTANV